MKIKNIVLLFLLFSQANFVLISEAATIDDKSILREIASIHDSLERQNQLEKYIKNAPDNIKYLLLPLLAIDCAHNNDFDCAEKRAHELLEMSKTSKSKWNYGNAIHDGNMVLGLVELNKGDITNAKKYLLLAGNTPGSPQIEVYGPNMMLADALLNIGEKEVVISYLENLRKVWTENNGKLESWIGSIKGGSKPYWGINLPESL